MSTFDQWLRTQFDQQRPPPREFEVDLRYTWFPKQFLHSLKVEPEMSEERQYRTEENSLEAEG